MSRSAGILFLAALCSLSVLSAAEPCPAGWTFNSANNHCYNLEATASPVTWVQARAACAAYSARTTLVTPGSQAENDYVYNYVKTEKAYNGNIWIGLEGNDAYAASGNETCSAALIAPSMGRKYSGSIGTGTGTVDPYGNCDMPGKENFFRFTAGVGGTWTFKVYSTFDAVIDLYSGACSSYLSCRDNSGANATETMTYTLTAGQTYTVVVDKYRTTDSGTYTLEIMAPTDNGKRAYSWIDDTDTTYTNWDSGEPNNSGGAEACAELKIGTTTYGKWNDVPCDSSGALHAYVCEYVSSICGDTVVEGIEECDDGNLTDGDGCDSNCRPTGCGNGLVTAGEQCDDGNVIDIDGCKNDCTLPCPDGWGYSTATGNCYNLYGVGDTKTWIEADAACETAYGNGTTLATIGDATENAFIFNYVKNTKAYNGNIWLGMEGETAYPSFGNETCSTAWMAPSMGRKYSGSIGTGTGTVDPYGWCDMPGKENFFRFTAGVSGYWRFSVYSTFDAVIDLYSGACTSYIDCEDYYGANATDWMEYPLTAGQVYTVVVDKYSTSDSGTYTLDIMPPTDRGKKAFSWIDDTDTTYTNWDTNEPSGGTEGCVEMKIATTTNAKWNDLACNSSSVKLAYTCETTGNILALQNKEAITELDLSNRGLTSLEGISAFTGLQALNASYNNLSNVSYLAENISVTTLNVSHNPIVDVDAFLQLPNLQQVTISHSSDEDDIRIISINPGENLEDFIYRIVITAGIPLPLDTYTELSSLLVHYRFGVSYGGKYTRNAASGYEELYWGFSPTDFKSVSYSGWPFGVAAEFDGNDQMIVFNHPDDYDTDHMLTMDAFSTGSDVTEDFSISLWVEPDNYGWERIFDHCMNMKCDETNLSIAYNKDPDYPSDPPLLAFYPSIDNQYEMSLTNLSNLYSGWIHYVYTYDASSTIAAIYINGDLIISGGSNIDNTANEVKYFTIGKNSRSSFDEFRIHASALTYKEVQDLYYFETCPDGMDHIGPDGACQSTCGDGELAPDEECDDGANKNNTDGCYDNCKLGSVPRGFLDITDKTNIEGWSCDPEDWNATITITLKFYDNDGVLRTTASSSGTPSEFSVVDRPDLITNGDVCKGTISHGFKYNATTIIEQMETAGYPKPYTVRAFAGNIFTFPSGLESVELPRSDPLADYVVVFCGNTIIEDATEQCDDGNAITEVCPYGVETCTVCDATCQNIAGDTSYCGDGVKDADNGEICDDGANNGTYGHCNSLCSGLGERCGDGVTQASEGEQCDDQDANPNNSCKNDCTLNVCGDNVEYTGVEECDDGRNENNCDGCLDNCTQHINTCGDGYFCGTEECDDGNTDNTDGCVEDCLLATCGDGFIRAGVEQCDDGILNGVYGYCNDTCSGIGEHCGDGIVNGTEICDDGTNNGEYDYCNSDCSGDGPYCGDSIVNGVEECDDQNAIDSDDCTSECEFNVCGDGILKTSSSDPLSIEECDDGNTSNADTCADNCQQFRISVSRPDDYFPTYYVGQRQKLRVEVTPPREGVPVYMTRQRYHNGNTVTQIWDAPRFTDANGRILETIDPVPSSMVGAYSGEEFRAGAADAANYAGPLSYTISASKTENCGDLTVSHTQWIEPDGVNPSTGEFSSSWDETAQAFMPQTSDCVWGCADGYALEKSAGAYLTPADLLDLRNEVDRFWRVKVIMKHLAGAADMAGQSWEDLSNRYLYLYKMCSSVELKHILKEHDPMQANTYPDSYYEKSLKLLLSDLNGIAAAGFIRLIHDGDRYLAYDPLSNMGYPEGTEITLYHLDEPLFAERVAEMNSLLDKHLYSILFNNEELFYTNRLVLEAIFFDWDTNHNVYYPVIPFGHPKGSEVCLDQKMAECRKQTASLFKLTHIEGTTTYVPEYYYYYYSDNKVIDVVAEYEDGEWIVPACEWVCKPGTVKASTGDLSQCVPESDIDFEDAKLKSCVLNAITQMGNSEQKSYGEWVLSVCRTCEESEDGCDPTTQAVCAIVEGAQTAQQVAALLGVNLILQPSSPGKIYLADVKKIKKLDCHYDWNAPEKTIPAMGTIEPLSNLTSEYIRDIEGLQHFTALEDLILSGQSVIDLTPLRDIRRIDYVHVPFGAKICGEETFVVLRNFDLDETDENALRTQNMVSYRSHPENGGLLEDEDGIGFTFGFHSITNDSDFKTIFLSDPYQGKEEALNSKNAKVYGCDSTSTQGYVTEIYHATEDPENPGNVIGERKQSWVVCSNSDQYFPAFTFRKAVSYDSFEDYAETECPQSTTDGIWHYVKVELGLSHTLEESKLRAEFALVTKVENGTPTFGYKESILNWWENETELSEAGCGTGERALKLSLWAPAIIADKGETTTDFQSANTPYTKIFCADERTGEIPVVRANREEGLLYSVRVVNTTPSGLKSLHLSRNYHIFNLGGGSLTHRSIHDLSAIAYHPNLTHLNLAGSPQHLVNGGEQGRELSPLIHTRKMKWLDLSDNMLQLEPPVNENDVNCRNYENWTDEPCQRRYGELRELRHMHDLQAFIARDTGIKYFNQRLDTLDRQCACGEHKDFKMPKPLKAENSSAVLKKGLTENIEIQRVSRCEGSSDKEIVVVGTIFHAFTAGYCSCGACNFDKMVEEAQKQVEDACQHRIITNPSNIWDVVYTGDQVDDSHPELDITDQYCELLQTEKCGSVPEKVYYKLVINQGDEKPSLEQLEENVVCRVNREGEFPTATYRYGSDDSSYQVLPRCDAFCEDQYSSSPAGTFQVKTVIDGKTANKYRYQASFPRVGVSGEKLIAAYTIEVQYDKKMLERFINDYNDPNGRSSIFDDGILVSDISPRNLKLDLKYFLSGKITPIVDSINLTGGTATDDGRGIVTASGAFEVAQSGPYDSIVFEIDSIKNSKNIFEGPISSWIPAYIKSVSIKDLVFRIGNGTLCEKNEIPISGLLTDTCKCDIYSGECNGVKKFEGDLAEQWPALEYLDLSDNPLENRSIEVAQTLSQYPDLPNGTHGDIVYHCSNRPWYKFIGRYDGFDKFKRLKGLYLENVSDNRNKEDRQTAANTYGCDISNDLLYTVLPRLPRTLAYLDISGVYPLEVEYAPLFPDLKNLRLRELDASHNVISQASFLDDVLDEQYDIEYLDLSGTTYINSFAFLRDMQNLRYLDLSGTAMTEAVADDWDIDHFGRLDYLDISATQVRTLQWLAATPEVQSLFINGTGLYDIESLDYLTKVMELGIAQHCIVKEESGLLVIDEDRIAEHTGQVAFLTGDDSMNAVCNGVQTATAVCGNGIREGSEQCDTEYIACAALNGTQYNIGYAYCLPPEASLFCTWDTSECGWTDDDIVSDEDIVPQPDIDSDLICTNGIVAHSLDGADFCLCNAGYYSLGDRCIKESIHSTGETSAEAAQENSGERENNSTYIEERMDIDTASVPDVDQSSAPDEDIVPLSQMQTEGCSYPTVESCFSEQYQRSRCGILFRGVCRDMMQFCLYVGGRCCIPQKDGNGNLLKICDPKYEGICEFKGSGTGFCTRKGLTGTEPYLGCRFSSASNDDCKAPVSSCRIEQTKYTCKTDEDCGCFDENCTYTCRNKLETGTTPDLSTLERVCTAIACDSGALKSDPDQCAVVSSKDQSKAICVPKDLAEEMELLGDDEGGCYYLEEDDLSINEETGTLQIERICRLPDPVLKFNRDCATFIGCLQNEQATINNYVRFNVPKLPDGADPGQDMKYTDEIDGGNDTQLAYLGSFPTGGRGSEDDFESETGSTEDYSITNCWLYNIDCGSGGEQQFAYYSLPLQSDESTFTVTRRSGRSAASYQSAIAKVINDTVTDNILSYAITESPVGYCNEKLTDCRDYATKKYIDIVNAMRLAAIYERQPIRGIREIFTRLPLYAPLAMHDLNSLVNTQYRAGDQMELLLNAPIKRGIRRSRNLFQEVVFYMSKTAETTEENGAHLKNGLFLQYDPNVPMAGGVDVSGFATQITPFFSGETLCQVPDPNENYLSNALCGEKSASHSLSNYRMLFGRPEIDDETLSVYEYKVKTISLLKEQLLDLLLARANIEELWQERKEEALRMNPADESLYGVHDIARKTKPLLAQLSVYRDYFDIQAIADIADPAILREYTKEKLPLEIAIKKARIQRFNELQAKLETDIRMSRYEDSPEAQKLWRDHYPRTRYYLDEMNAEKRAGLTQKERAELYPNGETEYLIDTVLRQIDHKIEKILQVAAVGPQMLALPGYNTAVGDFYCFDQNINPAILYLCDSEPSFFLKQAVNLLPPETLEKTYQECLSATNNDANAFGSLSEVTGKYEGGYLRNTANLWVFSPSQGWNSILDDLNNDNDLENVVLRLGNALREYQEWERSYKNKDAVAKVQEIEDYFSFGNTTFAFEEVEGEYLRQEIVRKEDPLLVGKNAFTSCFGSYEDHNKRSLDVLASLGSISTHPACRNISGSVAQPTTWQCFDMWEETYSAYLEEIQAVRDKMAIIEAEYKLKQAEMAARKLKAGGLLNPAAPQETAEGEEEKPRNPFAIPSNLEKWFSDYQQFGVDDLNANFTYIAGAGIKNLILDPNKYNPMPYMTDFHAFLPHLGKALLKHVNKSALDIALQDNPQLVELASLQLGQWMYNNLKNMKKLEQMYTNAMKQVQKFDLVKLKGLVKGKGLGNLIDDEKILEIVADELMKEIITRAYADGSLTAGTNITNPADILDILKTGANFSVEKEMTGPLVGQLESTVGSTTTTVEQKQAAAQNVLLNLEQQRQQIEAVVRGYETTMQGNVNIIRNEIKSKYGAGKNFYDFIRRLASSGNPAKVLTEDLIGASVLEMFLGQIFSGSLEADITFKIDGESLPCLKEYPDECREDVIDAIKDIPPNELLGKVKITQNGATKTIKEYFSSPSEAVNMVLDYRRLLRQAALSSTLDYMMQTLKVPNESAVMLRQIITTLMQTKSALACAPKFTGGSQPQLKCGSTVMDAGPVMSLPAGAIQLNLMDAVKGIFESASVRGTAVDIQASPETSVMALTAGYIDAAFLDSIPILKNRADPDVMKLRFVLSDFIAKIAYISWRSERLITRILDAVNGEYTPLKVYGEEGSSISPIETPALKEDFAVFGTTNTFAKTLKIFAREQGEKLLGKLIEKAGECEASSEKGCDINDFLGTLDMFGKYGNSSQLGTEIKLPDLGEIMNQLMVLMDSYQDDQGMEDFFKESMADVLDIYRLSSGSVTPQQLRSILLSGWSLDTGGVSLEQRPTENCLSPSDCTGKVTSVTDSLAVSSLSVPAQAELREELTDLPFTDTLNILLTALGRAGISSLANSQAPDLSKAWGNIGNFDQVILPPVYKTGFDTGLLDPNQLESNLSGISEDAGFRAVVSFPSFNFGHLKGAVEGSLQQLLAPALAQLDAYKTDAANLIEITDPEYWKGLLDKMVVPGFDDDHLSALNDLKVKIDALKTATDGSAITEIKYGPGGIAQIFNQKFQIATGTEGPLNEVVLPMETVQKVSYAIPQILIDPVFYQRVIKRIANETAIIAAFKEVFNGAASDPKSWLMATTGNDADPDLPSLVPSLLSDVSTLDNLFPSEEGADFMTILADAVIMRAEEVFMKELFKLPFAEVAMHTSADLHLFGFDADLFEATFYVTTRLDRDKYGRIIDLESVHPKARDKFIRRYDKKVEKFKPYTKYYFFAAMTSFDDLAETAVEAGKKALKEAADAAIKTAVGMAQAEIDKQLEAISTDVKDADKFESKIAKDPKLEDFKFAELEESDTINFQIGPVPAYLTYGFTFDAGIRYGIDYNYGWFRGLTVGASAGPYIVAGAFLEVGAGFDYTFLSFQIGIGGHIDIFDFYAPLKVQGMLKPELDLSGVGVKFYLSTSLIPELKLLAGYIYVRAKGSIGIEPIALKFNVTRTIFEWDPLIDMKFGNLIPLKPLKIDLFSIGEGVKLLGKEM